MVAVICLEKNHQRLIRLTSTVSTTLTISIEVIGTKAFACCVAIRISPGNLPNQYSDHLKTKLRVAKFRDLESELLQTPAHPFCTVINWCIY